MESENKHKLHKTMGLTWKLTGTLTRNSKKNVRRTQRIQVKNIEILKLTIISRSYDVSSEPTATMAGLRKHRYGNVDEEDGSFEVNNKTRVIR